MSTISAPFVMSRAQKRRSRFFSPSVIVASVFVFLVVLAAVFPEWLTSAAQDKNDLGNAMSGPTAENLLGTDQLGRDLYTRIVFGARFSLSIGLGATAIAVVVGTLLGIISGLGGRVVDTALMRFIDIMLAFPEILLALIVIAIIGPGAVNSLFAIGIAGIPAYARLVRSEALVVKGTGYVEASRALGLTRLKLIRRHILPNVLGPVLVLSTISVGTAMIAGSSLSFLGLGPAPPTPEWGALLSEGRNFLSMAWWLSLFPGLAITLSVISITVVGRRLQARFEGRKR